MRDIFSGRDLASIGEGLYWELVYIDEAQYEWCKALPVKLPELPGAVKKRRNEFYAGRWCAANCIYRLTGAWEIPERGSNRAPVWGMGICGSISHTCNWAIAAAGLSSDYRSVGIDLESTLALPEEAEWQMMVATKEEIELAATANVSSALALVFSAKESLFKALNPLTAKFIDFKEVRVVGVSDGLIELSLLRDLDFNFPLGKTFQVRFVEQKGHILTCLALCA